jgi:oligoendopeptidase F
MDALPARKDVEEKYTWDIASIFPNTQAWEQSFQEVEETLAGLRRFQGHLMDGPAVLAEWLRVSQTLRQKLTMTVQYARLNYAVDATNQQNAALNSRAGGLSARAAAAAAFEEPELMAIGFDKLRRWMDENPDLAVYAHYFSKLEKRSGHVRSAEVEELLSQLQDPFQTSSATHGILANADLKFKPARGADSTASVEVTHSKMRMLLASPDRKLRRNGWKSYADAHLAYKNTMANCLAAGIKQDVLAARVRRYGSSVEAALEGNHIPAHVFHNVISTFKANLPVWHRYWDLRRRVFGLKKLHVFDTYASLGGGALDISYEQAVDWIADGLKPLGEDYVAVLRKGALQERWVDSVMNKGKRFGAFSSGVQGTHPFIMMSFDRSIFGLSTLAHELGHSMHSYYTGKTQPFIYSRYNLFVAEVASNFQQAMVRANLLKTQTNRDFQLAVLQEAMANFYRYFFTMPVLAMFDLEMHERVERGEALTADIMNNVLADLLQAGYGPNVVVDRGRDGCLWTQFSTHLYSNFYAYQYTTGIAGAHALADGVLSGSAEARDHYRAFLQAGDSLYPVDALKLAGVDLTSPLPVEKTFSVLAGYVDQLEELLG